MRSRLRRTLFVAMLAVLASLPGVWWMNARSEPSSSLGVSAQGKLAPCPDSPNCVSSKGVGPHVMAPFPAPEGAAALERLKSIVRSMPRTKIVAEEAGYFRAEFRSLILGFVDDVEFLYNNNDDDTQKPCVDFRSASRVGYSDLGVNRKRMSKIRDLYLANLAKLGL